MNDRQRRSLLFIILGSVYSFAISLQVMTGTVLEFSLPQLFFTCLFFTLVLTVILYDFRTVLIFQIVIFLGLLLMFPALRDYKPEGEGALYKLLTQATDIYWYARGYLPYDKSYTAPIIAFCCFVTTFVTALSLYVVFSLFLLSTAGFTIFFAVYRLGLPRSDTAFFIFLICFIAFLAIRLNSRERASGLTFAFAAMPVAAALVIIAAYLPNPGTDMYDSPMRRPIDAITEQIYLLFNPSHFSFQSAGFTGKGGRLGGKVRPNDRQIMRVRTDERVYLAGAYYDHYTGESWEGTLEPVEFTADYFTDYSETVSRLYDMRRNDKAYIVLTPLFKGSEKLGRELTIDMGSARTSTVFQPPKAFDLRFGIEKFDITVSENSALETSVVMPRDTAYTINYISLSSVDEHFLEQRLTSSGKGRILQPYIPGFEYYTTMPDDEISRYLSLPEALPKRVGALARELTEGIPISEYKRAKAIEEYLLKIPYTLSPGDVPRDRDFVDYFLFDGKEGYCTYYASAMTVLCRAIGIPSRYVEGYVLPPRPAADGYYYVTNNNAHAWSEVYIEGFGWVVFEATAPYHFANSSLPSASSPIFAESMVQDPFFSEHLDSVGLEEDRRRRPAEPLPRGAQESTGGTFSPVFLTGFKIAVAIAVAVAYYHALLLLFSLYRRYDHRRISRMPNERQAEIYFSRLQRMCDYRFIYVRRRKHEMLSAHAKRLGRRFVFQNESLCMADAVDAIYKLRYSGRPLSDADAALLRSAYLEMWEQLCEIKPRHVLMRDKWLGRV